MSRDRALAEARVLKGFLEARGVRVSIELVEGTRKPSGWFLPPGQFRVEMSHHIVSVRTQGLTPFLHLVKVGRPDVKGPLCNGYGGWDETYRIITMGVANHSGRGGPMTLDGVTVAKDVAAYFAWGTEYEGGMNPRDWTPSYRRFMAASNAGIIDYLRHRNGKTTDQAHCEHSTWAPGRKSDRALYTRVEGIAEIRAARTGGPLSGYSADYVREVQTLLKGLGYDPGPIDGDLGPRTRSAIEAFQASHGLVVDGDPGPRTLGELRKLEDDVALTGQEKRALAWLDERRGGLDALRSQVGQLWQRRATIDKINTLAGQVAGLTSALEQIGAGKGVDLAAVQEAARKGAAEGTASAIEDIDVTVNLR